MGLNSGSLAAWESSVGTWGDEGLPLLVLWGHKTSGREPSLTFPYGNTYIP